MILKANTAYNIGFTINNSTGLAADADSLPTASVYANTTEIVASGSVTVAKITDEDGCYTASFTTPESVTLGHTVKLLVKAAVDTIASKAFINLGLFGKTVDELNDINVGAIRTELATELGRIDAAISSRSVYAGGAVASVTAGVTVTTNNDKTGYSIDGAKTTLDDLNDIAVGDKMDLVDAPNATAIAVIWNSLLSGMTTAGSVGKKLSDWVVGQVKGIDNIDFPALQKTSLNAATPSVTVSNKEGFSLTAAYDKAKTAAQPGDTMGKSPATLAAGDVTGNLPVDVKAISTGVDLSQTMKDSVNAACDTANADYAASKPATPQTITNPVDLAVNVTKMAGVSVTSGAIPAAVAGASGGLAIVGSKQTLANGSITAEVIVNDALDGKGDWNTVVPDNENIRLDIGALGQVVSDVKEQTDQLVFDSNGALVVEADINTSDLAKEETVQNIKDQTDKLNNMIVEDTEGNYFADSVYFEMPPATAEVDAEDLAIAMKAITGITDDGGGTWTWLKIMQIMIAWAAGNWRVKSDNPLVQELLDPENGTTVILEQTLTRSPDSGGNYRTIVVKI